MPSHHRQKLTIGIVHYRVGRTDGVSLEIAKRKQVLEALGHEVHMIAGQFSNGHDLLIPELEADLPEIISIKENAFTHFNKSTLTSDELMRRIGAISDSIKQTFLQCHQQQKFDLLLVHNIFSFGLHLPAAKAFAEIAQEHNIPIIATNHDYYWERQEYLETTSQAVDQFICSYLPFKHKSITYVSINSIAQHELFLRCGIKSDLLADVFDFSQPAWQPDDYNASFLGSVGVKDNDLIILQATRVVKRKGIELAIDLVSKLSQQKHLLYEQTLYNQKKITTDSEVVLMFSGFTELADRPYRAKLEEHIKQAGIKALFVNDMISAKRKPGQPKIYSLWDSYVHADLITYPSLYEGWGNQFIEAVFAKKPIVLFEYPVFKTDIKNEGYHYISLGDELTGTRHSGLVKIDDQLTLQVATECLNVLTDQQTNSKLEENFSIGRQHHDTRVLTDYLTRTINKLIPND